MSPSHDPELSIDSVGCGNCTEEKKCKGSNLRVTDELGMSIAEKANLLWSLCYLEMSILYLRVTDKFIFSVISRHFIQLVHIIFFVQELGMSRYC